MYQVAPKKHTGTSKSCETIPLKPFFSQNYIMLALIKSRILELQLIQNRLDTIFCQNFAIFDEIWPNFAAIKYHKHIIIFIEATKKNFLAKYRNIS
jgi:hypothetical protein